MGEWKYRKIATLLEDHAYRMLKKNPADSVERKTTLLLKKLSISEEAYQKLRSQASRPPRLYGLPQIHKQGNPLRTIMNTIGAPHVSLGQTPGGPTALS
jgi:hypothetical protein